VKIRAEPCVLSPTNFSHYRILPSCVGSKEEKGASHGEEATEN